VVGQERDNALQEKMKMKEEKTLNERSPRMRKRGENILIVSPTKL